MNIEHWLWARVPFYSKTCLIHRTIDLTTQLSSDKFLLTFINILVRKKIVFLFLARSQEVPTTERIDMSKLTSRDPIYFYQDLCLFEDELSDHGVAKLSVKIRVMRSNLFVLLRFFLRVDQVLIRMNDTRLYWEQGTEYILREYAEREHKDAKNLNVCIVMQMRITSLYIYIYILMC